MEQIKIYGLKENLNSMKQELANIIHSCVVEAFEYPVDKRFHRFFPLEREDFYFPEERSDAYTVIEISMFEGRSIVTKKNLINLLYQKINEVLEYGRLI